jgi:hypothetical protein
MYTLAKSCPLLQKTESEPEISFTWARKLKSSLMRLTKIKLGQIFSVYKFIY